MKKIPFVLHFFAGMLAISQSVIVAAGEGGHNLTPEEGKRAETTQEKSLGYAEQRPFPLVVELEVKIDSNLGEPLAELVDRGNYFDFPASIVEESYPLSKEPETVKKQIVFSVVYAATEKGSAGIIGTERILKAIDKSGNRPATVRELLVFGEKGLADQHIKFPILALGAKTSPNNPIGETGFLELIITPKGKMIAFTFTGDTFSGNYHRFLVVRK